MEWKGAEKLSYRSFYGQLAPSQIDPPSPPLDWVDPNWILITPPGIQFRRWVVFNDGTNILHVKINNLENDEILIYPGEYFGDSITGKAIYLKNGSTTSVLPYRVVISGVF